MSETFTRFVAAIAMAASVAGCQTAAQAPATASGKPEVTIRAQTAAIKARLISMAMDKRFNVTKDTEYLLQIEKPSENIGAALLLGSRYDGVPSERIVFTFAPIGDSVRVVASGMYVTNPGSAFERITQASGGDGGAHTQSTLDQLKLSMETPAAAPQAAPVASARKPKPAS